jgi:hypothetical protein
MRHRRRFGEIRLFSVFGGDKLQELCFQLRPSANESCGHSVGAAKAKDDSGMKNRAKANDLTFIRQLQGLRCLTVDYPGKKGALLPYLSSLPS